MKMKSAVGKGRARVVVLAVCAAAILAPIPASAATSDPFEPMNRALFGVHEKLDHYLIRPMAMVYERLLPKIVRKGLTHVFGNLGEPAVFVNDVLQGHPKAATHTLTRFVGNSTFGVLGLFDVATPAGLPHHDNDFGITLARWGVGPGPYLFIPVAGPFTVRDGVGEAVGLALNPLIYLRYAGDKSVAAATTIATGLQTRIDVDQDLRALYASATDPYASFRSFYLQNRESLINGGRIDLDTLPDFGPDPSAPPSATTDSMPGSAPPPAPDTTAPPPPPETTPPATPSASAPPPAPPTAVEASVDAPIATARA